MIASGNARKSSASSAEPLAGDIVEQLVGREADLARISGFFTRRGSGRSLLLSGDPGVGKTALLRAMGKSATADGVRVLRIAGVQFEADLSYAALNQAAGPDAKAANASETVIRVARARRTCRRSSRPAAMVSSGAATAAASPGTTTTSPAVPVSTRRLWPMYGRRPTGRNSERTRTNDTAATAATAGHPPTGAPPASGGASVADAEWMPMTSSFTGKLGFVGQIWLAPPSMKISVPVM
ncbi:ATP-binding protein [Streptomyces sp. NPDC007162]|uniref:ATP-binding protein n=1 Tax=Streptomyces sp. NPDC007162 TaxID=3156917 RepID=UPI0033C01B19